MANKKNILSSEWEYGTSILYFSLFACYSIIAIYILESGYSMSSDSERFSKWADDLIKFNFNLFEFYSIDKDYHRPNLFFFSIPVILIAICKLIFVNEWQFAFLLLNLVFVLFSIIIFINILLLIKVRPLLISLTLPLIAISVDMLIWPRFILSDVIYTFVVILSVYFIVDIIVKNKINLIKLFLIIFLLLSSRPSSIPVIFSILLFIFISSFKTFIIKKHIKLFLLSICISTPFVLGFAYLLLEYNFNENPKVEYLINMVNSGMIIHDRPNTWVDTPNSFIDIVNIYYLRILNFFNPYASTFSVLHIILNSIQIVLVLLSIILWLVSVNYDTNKDKVFWFILLLSLSVSAFHSFTLIDYDWRYRFPLILPLIILIPISLEIILNKLIKIEIKMKF